MCLEALGRWGSDEIHTMICTTKNWEKPFSLTSLATVMATGKLGLKLSVPVRTGAGCENVILATAAWQPLPPRSQPEMIAAT